MFTKKPKLLVIAVFLLSGLSVVAQINVTGTIQDAQNGKPLSGAGIVVENTYLTGTSGADGSFVLKNLSKGSQTIRFSYMGYETYRLTLDLKKDTTLAVLLENAALLGEEVNIVATRVQPGTPATFSTLSSKKIAEVNFGKDMPYVLQSTPSVLVTSDAGTGIGYTGISIRGTDLTRINVTMNGIPVNDPESQGVWFVDLPDLASSSSSIQVQRGVGTSTNGSGAFGGSINIFTQTLNHDPYGELSSSAGSFSTFRNTLKFGTGIMKNHFAFDGRASYITSQGYIDRASARLQSWHLSGGYFGKTTTIRANVLSGNEVTYQAWEGVPRDSLATNRTYNPAGQYYDKDGNILYYSNQTDNYQQDHYQLMFSQSLGKNLNLNAAFFYTKGAGYYESYRQDKSFSSYGLEDVIIGGDTITSTDAIDRKILDNDFSGITFSGNYHSDDKLKITLGGSYLYYHGRHSGKVIWASYASNGNNERNWYYSTGIKKDFTIYTKVNYRVISRINLFADLQYRYVNHDMDGTRDDLSALNQNPVFNFFNPKAGVYVDITQNQKAYVSFGIANREPNRDNFEDADENHMPSAETLYDYELGYELSYNRFRTGINLYYMNYNDQLVLTGQINNTGAAIMTNVPKSYRLGVELGIGANILKWLDWNFNATLSRNKIRDFTEYVDQYDEDWNFTGQASKSLGETDLSFSPAIMGFNEFVIRPLKGLSLNLQSRYTGRQYIDNTSSEERSLDPYFVQNVIMSYSFNPRWIREISISALANNIFSNEYETNAWVYRYAMSGNEYEMNGYFPQALINYMVGLTVRF